MGASVTASILTLDDLERPDVVWEECPNCEGLGFEMYWDDEEQEYWWHTDRPCSHCDGTGELPVPAVPIEMEDTLHD